MGEAIYGSYLGLFLLVDAMYKTKEGNFERLQHFRHSVPNIFCNRVGSWDLSCTYLEVAA